MLTGIFLIVLLLFAVLGIYDAAVMILQAWSRRKSKAERVVVLKVQEQGNVWESILDTRLLLPDVPIVVLCEKRSFGMPPDANLRGVAFAQDETLVQTVHSMKE